MLKICYLRRFQFTLLRWSLRVSKRSRRGGRILHFLTTRWNDYTAMTRSPEAYWLSTRIRQMIKYIITRASRLAVIGPIISCHHLLTKKLDFCQPDVQTGFRAGFGTNDNLQVIKTLVEHTQNIITILFLFLQTTKRYLILSIIQK